MPRQVLEALPGDVPRLLLHDRSAIYGWEFNRMVKALGIRQIRSASRSPWQNAFAERSARSVKEECLSRMIFFGEASLRRAIREYVEHDHRERPHQSTGNETIEAGPRQTTGNGIRCEERLGGLLRHSRRAA